MSQHHDSHGGGGHAWVARHLGGIVMPFGRAFERVADRTMVFAVMGSFEKLARWYLVLFTPVILLQFLVFFLHS